MDHETILMDWVEESPRCDGCDDMPERCDVYAPGHGCVPDEIRESVAALRELSARLFDGHLRILSTPWWSTSDLFQCPFCPAFTDEPHEHDCPYLASLIACGLADEPKGEGE